MIRNAVILFVHGFASCGIGEKSKTLLRHYGHDRVLTPDLSFRPAEAAGQLEDLLDSYPVDLIVGSSLGGHYATWVNRNRPRPTVLINPAVRPSRLLSAYCGTHQRWCDDQPFELTDADIRTLSTQFRPELTPAERYLVLLQSGDEVLDYRLARDYYQAHRVIVGSGGNHRFENLADYLPVIDSFRNSSSLMP